jgi:hypothetical protein
MARFELKFTQQKTKQYVSIYYSCSSITACTVIVEHEMYIYIYVKIFQKAFGGSMNLEIKNNR